MLDLRIVWDHIIRPIPLEFKIKKMIYLYVIVVVENLIVFKCLFKIYIEKYDQISMKFLFKYKGILLVWVY